MEILRFKLGAALWTTDDGALQENVIICKSTIIMFRQLMIVN